MKSLESLDGRQTTPVDGLRVPDSDGTQNSADPVAKQANRDSTQDHSRGGEGKIVE